LPEVHQDKQQAHGNGRYGQELTQNGNPSEGLVVVQVIRQYHHNAPGSHPDQECKLGNIESPGHIPAHTGDSQAETELLEIEKGPEGDDRAEKSE